MKNLLLILICLLVSTPSFGKWKKFAMSEGSSFYIYEESIKKIDGFHYVWVLHDYPKPTDTGVLSSKVYFQIDCKILRFKYINSMYYGGLKGEGDVISNHQTPDKDWSYPAPETVNEALLNVICKS